MAKTLSPELKPNWERVVEEMFPATEDELAFMGTIIVPLYEGGLLDTLLFLSRNNIHFLGLGSELFTVIV